MRDRLSPSHPALATPAVWHPTATRRDYAVVLFRIAFDIPKALKNIQLWLSASERFTLWCDGQVVGRGPARSDLTQWRLSHLRLNSLAAGRHVLAASVAHCGPHAGMGQLGGPAFWLLTGKAAGADLAKLLTTGPAWRCWHDTSIAPLAEHGWGKRKPFFVVGNGEHIAAATQQAGWQQPDFDDSTWQTADVVASAPTDVWGNRPLGCELIADCLPNMEERPHAWARVAEADAVLHQAAEALISTGAPLTIAPRQRARIVLDAGEPVNTYITLRTSGGAGAVIDAVYAEAPYLNDQHHKADRDVVAGRLLLGQRDRFSSDGRSGSIFSPQWLRSFRYLELTITTADQPLSLEACDLRWSGFPLTQQATLTADAAHDASWRSVFDLCWRTIRACAHESFWDCPHYEQCQFPGDTRVQALYHYLIANEDRLGRKAICDFLASREHDGLLWSRYPARKAHLIPTFSLYWVAMLHDFVRYRGDTDFIAPFLPAARGVIDHFLRLQRSDGLLGFVEHAPFMDWTAPFACGNVPQDRDGGSSILSLLVAITCQQLAELELSAGHAELAPRWRTAARSLLRGAARCWDAKRGLLADTPAKRSFSVHAQTHAVLAGLWPAKRARTILAKALSDQRVTQPGSYYFRFYVLAAMRACGWGDGIFSLLPAWTKLLHGTGLKTLPESDGNNPRSDCHGWGISPALSFCEDVLGLCPAPQAVGFNCIAFAPHLGPMQQASGSLRTPAGMVKVSLDRDSAGRTVADLHSPVSVLLANGKRLRPGKHRVVCGAR